jgi:hypothetical protein
MTTLNDDFKPKRKMIRTKQVQEIFGGVSVFVVSKWAKEGILIKGFLVYLLFLLRL